MVDEVLQLDLGLRELSQRRVQLQLRALGWRIGLGTALGSEVGPRLGLEWTRVAKGFER